MVQKEPNWWVKLGDFGISKRISSEQTALMTRVGTARFLAPEVEDDDLLDCAYTQAVDIWSVGCVLYNILAQRPPFMTTFSKRKPLPEEPLQARAGYDARNFIRLLLSKNPIHRPTAVAALSDQWFIKANDILVRRDSVQIETDSILQRGTSKASNSTLEEQPTTVNISSTSRMQAAQGPMSQQVTVNTSIVSAASKAKASIGEQAAIDTTNMTKIQDTKGQTPPQVAVNEMTTLVAKGIKAQTLRHAGVDKPNRPAIQMIEESSLVEQVDSESSPNPLPVQTYR